MNSKPLSTTLGDALAAKGVAPASTPLQRPSPPAARPSRIVNYREAPPPVQLHALPPPDGPDRSAVANDGADAVNKKKRAYKVAPDDVKAEAVRRVLADKQSVTAVATGMGVSQSSVSKWVIDAKKAAAKETLAKVEASDIEKVSKELAEAIQLQRAAAERVKVLKAKMRELLGDD